MVEVFKGTPIRRMTTGGNYVNLTADVVLLSDYAALRAELEQVKRNNIGLHDEVQFMRNAAKENREAAERLAGARVEIPSDELHRYIERCREMSNRGEYSWWSRLSEILSALAEPAGEAEPSKWSIPGSTYAGATTPPVSAMNKRNFNEVMGDWWSDSETDKYDWFDKD